MTEPRRCSGEKREDAPTASGGVQWAGRAGTMFEKLLLFFLPWTGVGAGGGCSHPGTCHCHQTAWCCVCPRKTPRHPLNKVLSLNAFLVRPGCPAPSH